MRKIMILTAVAVVLTGCFHDRKAEHRPEDTLENFYRCLCAGNFDGASALCDSLSMNGYIEGIRNAWEDNDSTVRPIVSDILSETAVTVTGVEKDGQARTVFYRLTAADGQNKEKAASLEKEEGAWKIKAITDRH